MIPKRLSPRSWTYHVSVKSLVLPPTPRGGWWTTTKMGPRWWIAWWGCLAQTPSS